MFKYRDHRGSLAGSMKTVQSFESRDDLVNYLQTEIDKYGPGKYDCTNITIKPYVFDERIGWDSYIVHSDEYGVFGFTDGPVD